MNKKILYLTLKKKWFDLIASNKKKIEYRKIKEYWSKRLFDGLTEETGWQPKEFDEVHFRNGYGKNRPFMRVEFIKITYGMFEKKRHYAIYLGEVLETRK